jgi:hypothetical protein
LAFGIFSLHSAFGQSFTKEGKTLQISGHYSYIFSNGAPPETNNYNFIAFTASNGWKISSTNANQPKEWGIMRYDGTNIYTIGVDSLNRYKIYGYAYPGQFYLPEADDPPHFFFPWMTFYLTPGMIHDFERNHIEIPPPWGRRYSLLDYGFRWKTTYFSDNAAIQKIDVVRDSSLDLKTEEDELRRAGINYAFEYSALDHTLQELRARKNFPDGFVGETYECEGLYQTNGWLIPSVTRFAQYWPDFNDPKKGPVRLVFQITLQVDAVNLLQNTGVSEIILPAKATVYDYRYQATNSRTKFNYARYTLDAGDTFLPDNDPKLLAEAQDWLKNGPAYGSLEPKRRKILAGMVIITLLMSGFLVFGLKRNNKQ